ncbi:MAG: hypothetical protein P8100_12360 [bacterium]
MKHLVIAVLAGLFIFHACKKEENISDNPPQPQVTDYFPLQVGNYWIYEQSTCDSGEINCEVKGVDTSFIEKDTSINGKQYFKYITNFPMQQTTFLRDSGDYIVDLYGEILFTHSDSAGIFNEQFVVPNGEDTLYRWYYRLTFTGNVNVPAGLFDCMDMRGHIFRLQDDYMIDHNTHHFYALRVGPVKKTAVYASNLSVIKQELTGYHIEPDGGVIP